MSKVPSDYSNQGYRNRLRQEAQALHKAFDLARWLIEEKGKNRTTAYIIGARKFGIENWHDVQKEYNKWLASRQQTLFKEDK